jgi:hypothetical protein
VPPALAAQSVDLWWLRLWQQGERVLGWYEPVTGEPGRRWVVSGELRGRTLLLRHQLGDGATVARQLELSPDGATLRGAWPAAFGPPGEEELGGAAACLAAPPAGPPG